LTWLAVRRDVAAPGRGAGCAMLDPHRLPLERIRRALAQHPALARVLNIWVAAPLLDPIAKLALYGGPPDYVQLTIAAVLALWLASATIGESVADWLIDLLAGALIPLGIAELLSQEYGRAAVAFLFGLPGAPAVVTSLISSPYAKLAAYGYAVYLGPVVCYEFVNKPVAAWLGLNALGWKGYAAAAGLGLLLAAEAPTTYAIDGRMRAMDTRRGFVETPLIPLTPYVGIVMGFGIALLISALALMLMWWEGWIVAPVLLFLVWYALRLR
jgi:hypothetical protein